MNCKIVFYPLFEREAKRLAKHYPSFKEDLKTLIQELRSNPYCGVEIAHGLRKVRMAIKSKGKGKRGGARVITMIMSINEENPTLGLQYIYDKSSIANISDSEIRLILKNNGII